MLFLQERSPQQEISYGNKQAVGQAGNPASSQHAPLGFQPAVITVRPGSAFIYLLNLKHGSVCAWHWAVLQGVYSQS